MKTFNLLAALIFAFLTASAQKPIQYSISFPNAIHHEAQVNVSVSNIPNEPLIMRMSKSSPGRYATHEFGKNIYNIKAFDIKGKPLIINQVEGDVFQIPTPSNQVNISYTIFGNWVDGTYLGIDETHAHINMPATFIWIKGMENNEIQLSFKDLNKYNWKVATQLKPTKDSTVFTAPNMQYFMDSPTELSNYKKFSWQDVNADKTVQTINLIVHSDDNQDVVDSYSKMVQKIVQEAKSVYGELPKFDYGNYTFLQDIHIENAGDGMEHRNSTIITDKADKLEGNEKDFFGTISHEFFHSWNVERIRPKSLEPFDFEQANMSSELWMAEGFTQYYGELILKRAELSNQDDYNSILSGMLNYVLNSPGAKKFSPAQMSRCAVFVDAGVAIDQSNYSNNFTSYYYYGAITALALDLRLRSEFNKTLDDYMQALWKAHGKNQIPYTISDLQNILTKLTNTTFSTNFFRRYIYGSEKNDFEKLLNLAGLDLRKAMPGKASLGPLSLAFVNGKVRLTSSTIEETSVYEAGLDNGDYLLKIGTEEIKEVAQIKNLIEKYKPEDVVNITFEHRNLIKTATIKIKENSKLEVVSVNNPTPQQIQFRKSWLTSTNSK